MTENKIKQHQNKLPVLKSLMESENEAVKLQAEIENFTNSLATRL